MSRRVSATLSAVSMVCLVYVSLGTIQSWRFSRTVAASGEQVERHGAIQFGEWDGGRILRRHNFLGFQRVDFLRNNDAREDYLYDVPYWPFILFAAVLPLLWARQRWRDHQVATRASKGLCVRCGYDLRASTPGPCPECGTIAAAKEA